MEESQLKIKELDNKKQIEMKKVGIPGRPTNITETKKRKPKPTEKPSTKAGFIDIFLWSHGAQETISDMVNKSLLESLEKPNIRSLSRDEFNLIESIKLDILCSFEPFEKIVPERVYASLLSGIKADSNIVENINILTKKFISVNNRQPSIDEKRQIYSSAYALFYEEG
jgi:hypothetical protein